MKNFFLAFFESESPFLDPWAVSAHLRRHFSSIDWKLRFVGEFIDTLRICGEFHGRFIFNLELKHRVIKTGYQWRDGNVVR